MNTAEILRAAAVRVRANWLQGGYANSQGGVCAVGAVCVVQGIDASDYGANEQINAVDHGEAGCVLRRALGMDPNGYIHVWNDAPNQTAENVAAGLEYAALVWEQEHAVDAVARVEGRVTSGPRA